MIVPIFMIALATKVVSQQPIQSNESSVTTETRTEDRDMETYTNSEIFRDVESEHICKRVVITNMTKSITFRVETRTKCEVLSEDCNKDGYKFVRSVGYRNLTVTERRSEHVCCDGFTNHTGKCIKDVVNTIFNETSGIMEGETTNILPILIIALPLVGAVVIVVIIIIIFKLRCSNKRPREEDAPAHANPMYDSSIGQSHVRVENMYANHEEPNHDLASNSIPCIKSCQVSK